MTKKLGKRTAVDPVFEMTVDDDATAATSERDGMMYFSNRTRRRSVEAASADGLSALVAPGGYAPDRMRVRETPVDSPSSLLRADSTAPPWRRVLTRRWETLEHPA